MLVTGELITCCCWKVIFCVWGEVDRGCWYVLIDVLGGEDMMIYFFWMTIEEVLGGEDVTSEGLWKTTSEFMEGGGGLLIVCRTGIVVCRTGIAVWGR